MSWDDSNYYKRALRDNEDLNDIPFTGKKKRSIKKCFVIEHKHHNNMFVWSRFWRIVGKYKTEESAMQAFTQLQKNRNHLNRPVKIQIYKTKSVPSELSRFGVIINGDLYEEYRLVKQD